MIEGHPCRVVEYNTSKSGKHGRAKADIIGIDIFTETNLKTYNLQNKL